MNLRDKILKAKDIPVEVKEVPEWGVSIEIRGMTGKQRSDMIAATLDKKGKTITGAIYPELLTRCLYDPETGEPIFTQQDAEQISGKSGHVLERLARIASRLSGISDEALETAEKNSD